eukprot:Hpha_TRINITY_DN15068_c1_g2::TRINITY_DN15068_c1_g2_i1::g.125969::m.125969
MAAVVLVSAAVASSPTAAPLHPVPDQDGDSEDQQILVLAITGSVLFVVLVCSIAYMHFSTPKSPRRSRVYHHSPEDVTPDSRKPSTNGGVPMGADPNYAFPQESPETETDDVRGRDEPPSRTTSIRKAVTRFTSEEDIAQAAKTPQRTILRKPNQENPASASASAPASAP